MISDNRDDIEDHARHPGWQFELRKPNHRNRAEIPAVDIQRLKRLWEIVRREERFPESAGREMDALIEKWGLEGYSADQIAAATQLPLETVAELQKIPGVGAHFNSRQA